LRNETDFKGSDVNFHMKYILFLFINKQFAYTSFISCQATRSYSYLFEFRI